MQGGGGLRGRHTNEAQMQFTAAAPPLPPPRPPPSFLRHSAARRRPARTHACRGAARHREKVGEGNFYRKYDVKACGVRFFLPGGHISARVQLRLRSLSAFRYLYALFRQTLSLLFRLFIQPLLSRFLDGFATGRPSSAGDCASAAHQRCTRLAALAAAAALAPRAQRRRPRVVARCARLDRRQLEQPQDAPRLPAASPHDVGGAPAAALVQHPHGSEHHGGELGLRAPRLGGEGVLRWGPHRSGHAPAAVPPLGAHGSWAQPWAQIMLVMRPQCAQHGELRRMAWLPRRHT